LERLHDLLGALEAFGVRVPDLSDQVPQSIVALSVRGYLLLLGREVRAFQVVLECAYIQVALVHARFSLCVRLQRQGICLPRCAVPKRAAFQDLAGSGTSCARCVMRVLLVGGRALRTLARS
jgi:hypothetical protein